MIFPGVRQDHLGRYYYDTAEGPMFIPAPAHDFKMRFYGESKGHRWHFKTSEKPRVERCNDSARCSVCGPRHNPKHEPVEKV